MGWRNGIYCLFNTLLLGVYFSNEMGSTELRAIVTDPEAINVVIPLYGRIGIKV